MHKYNQRGTSCWLGNQSTWLRNHDSARASLSNTETYTETEAGKGRASRDRQDTKDENKTERVKERTNALREIINYIPNTDLTDSERMSLAKVPFAIKQRIMIRVPR